MVFVHGLSENHQTWTQQVAEFSKRFSAVAIDVRGFGDSEVGTAEGTPRQLADDLAAVVKHLARDGRAHVVGFSMGGVIAVRFALDHPDLARSVVIASSSAAINDAGFQWFQQRLEAALTHP